MAKYHIENEKYLIRPIEESDFEQVKTLIKSNKFMSTLFSMEGMGDVAESVLQSMYVDSDSSYCIILKETGAFLGHAEISPEQSGDDEGELAVRLIDEADVEEIMKIFGDIFKEIGHKAAKNIRIQYSFE